MLIGCGRCIEKNVCLRPWTKRLGNEYDVEEAQRLLLLGLACSHPIAHERPNSQTIVQVISGSIPAPQVSLPEPARPENRQHCQSELVTELIIS